MCGQFQTRSIEPLLPVCNDIHDRVGVEADSQLSSMHAVVYTMSYYFADLAHAHSSAEWIQRLPNTCSYCTVIDDSDIDSKP